jgi:hypothetical protein
MRVIKMKKCPLKPFMKGANKTQMRMGAKVEMEHTTSRALARRIASQHLAEIPNYYTLLNKMERKAMRK